MSGLQKLMVIRQQILEIEVRSTNVGTVTRRENFMRRLMIILSMTVLLTSCTSRFDGFDPSTAMVRWVFTNANKYILFLERVNRTFSDDTIGFIVGLKVGCFVG